MSLHLNRRVFIGSTGALLAAMGSGGLAMASGKRAMARVILDNDFAGDPDGLFQLAHHLLSPSVIIPLLVSSHLPVKFGGPASAAAGAAKAQELMEVMQLAQKPPVVAGAELPIASRSDWKPSPASAAIVREAMREDTEVPLFFAAGASLTELALAWLAEPKIGRRLKLVWIGGREHPGLAYPPPGPDEAEFNFAVDALAAQIIFNESDIEIWQVPRDVYRQVMYSMAELNELAMTSPLARYLKRDLDNMEAALAKIPGFPSRPSSEVYVLGDSPLVTLTALMTPIQPDSASSQYRLMATPRLTVDGHYEDNPGGRPMRVYTTVDTSLTIRDMVAKFRAGARPE
ncbi:nucleoside hydrolase [Novosphingobium mathurense]|uniref:Inosine-uridine preferring nucleoside hydrolase n=1 Tax=Novosphingobium mathurense TaxID=428990 RepID=A0A1U6IV96_9SPHN|nr:nucleoside hydrolase [Novosphingobium mathurense]SLK11912.1 Inosine-uridine preferring nucleoside hydrolase [Novosphingobium mathurense]